MWKVELKIAPNLGEQLPLDLVRDRGSPLRRNLSDDVLEADALQPSLAHDLLRLQLDLKRRGRFLNVFVVRM